MNLLAINVGNTRVQLGAFIDGKLLEHETLAGAGDESAWPQAVKSLAKPLRDAGDFIALMASVNDALAGKITKIVEAELSIDVVRTERDVSIPIGRQLDRESIIGEDRLLTAAAAYEKAQQACVVVDAGTAVTVDFVDGAGTFHGGAILPGATMQLNAMHEHTAQLPELRFTKPDEAIGHNTAQAMLDGVFHGIRGAVRELVEKYAEFYGAYPMVIATGGDAETLFRDYELVEAIAPGLALEGLALTAKKAAEDEE